VLKTTDLNSRIAKAKGEAWATPEGKRTSPPDRVNTLKGVAGMLFDLFNLRQGWQLGIGYLENGDLGWAMVRAGWSEVAVVYESYMAARDNLGDCVSNAWLSAFGKETAQDEAVP